MTGLNERLERGWKARREALGEERYAGLMKDPSKVNRRWQDFVAEYSWGECWTDPTLSPRDRSILMLGINAALGRPEEFEGHVTNALRNGLSMDEIEALLVMIGVYCGVPVGSMCHRAISNVLKQRAETE
ncbi:MAG: carboxymuconolactone decarboxylase family protein [Pseudomonadota bacterium]